MTTKEGASTTRPDKIDRERRKLLKLAAAGGAGLITSPWTFQSSRAAAKTIKIGMITPETGPIAAFGEPSKWVAEERQQVFGRRHRRRRRETSRRDSQPGQPIESEPRIGSGGAAHQ